MTSLSLEKQNYKKFIIFYKFFLLNLVKIDIEVYSIITTKKRIEIISIPILVNIRKLVKFLGLLDLVKLYKLFF